MAQVNPHLTFNGNCEEAFSFYRSVFGGEFRYIGKFKDMPVSMEGQPKLSAGDAEKIMHVSLPISRETILTGSDSYPAYGPVPTGQNISISITAESKPEADSVFQKLSSGGESHNADCRRFLGRLLWNGFG